MKKFLSVALAAVMMLSLAACGSSSNKAESSSEGGSASDKTYIIAKDTTFAPFEFTNDKNEFVGIDVDILAAIAKDQGFEYELKSLGWDASIAACQTGQADGMIAGASITDERKESGEYNEIIAKYLGEDAVPTEEAADDAEADTTEAPAEEEAAE